MCTFDYLDSLDSVRNSDAEVILGQNELLDRLFYTDHTVVLTMQQLTDGRVFGNLLRDKDCTEYILFQFVTGRLRYSQYGTIKTPSQYVQNSLTKCKDSGYLFSYLPIRQADEKLLNAELDALRNGSLEYLEELKEERPAELAQIEFLENYTRLILSLGTLNLAKTTPKPKEDCRSLTEFLDAILEGASKIKASSANEKTREAEIEIHTCYKNAKQILTGIRPKLEGKSVQNRTEWHNYLRNEAAKESGDRRSYWLAEAIIDVAYNLTLADSIHGCVVPKGEELEQKVQTKLIGYWKLAQISDKEIEMDGITSTSPDNYIHEFLKQDGNATYDWNPAYDKIKERWKELKTLTEDMDKVEKQKAVSRSWSSRLKRLSFQLIINCILAVLVFGVVEFIASIDYISFFSDLKLIGQKLSELYQSGGLLSGVMSKVQSYFGGQGFINDLLNIFVIGTLFTALSIRLKVQDFLDSLKKLWRGIGYGYLSYKSSKYPLPEKKEK